MRAGVFVGRRHPIDRVQRRLQLLLLLAQLVHDGHQPARVLCLRGRGLSRLGGGGGGGGGGVLQKKRPGTRALTISRYLAEVSRFICSIRVKSSLPACSSDSSRAAIFEKSSEVSTRAWFRDSSAAGSIDPSLRVLPAQFGSARDRGAPFRICVVQANPNGWARRGASQNRPGWESRARGRAPARI